MIKISKYKSIKRNAFIFFIIVILISISAKGSSKIFYDDFDDNTIDTSKWMTDIVGSLNSYEEINQEAKFTVYGGHSYLVSKILNITNWQKINISGLWKAPGVTTAEMNLYVFDNKTDERIGVAYDNWFDKIRYWYSNSRSEEITRASPQTYSSFILSITPSTMQYWENDVLLKENSSNVLKSTTNFQIKIGGWDYSSTPNQIFYFDEIAVNVEYLENETNSDQKENYNASMSFIFYNTSFLDNQIGSRSLIGSSLGKEYAIPVATAISIFLLFLLNFFIEFISDYSSEKIIEYQKDKKGSKTSVKTKSKRVGKFLDKKELISVIFTTVIFSFVLSWTWAPDMSIFLEVFIVTIIIVAVVILLKESFRAYLCYKKKLYSEYYVWPLGSIMMIVSTFLGNTFSLAANHNYDDKGDIKKCGNISFIVSFVLYIVVLLAFIANLFYHSAILQMIVIATILNLFIDLFPLNPMDGYEIRHWNIFFWVGLYVCVMFTYIVVYFNIYP